MEQKSLYSGIEVQSPSKCITIIPAIPALPVLPIHKKICVPFTIPLFHLFLIPKINYQKECSLTLPIVMVRQTIST